jgi:hypothetical protein
LSVVDISITLPSPPLFRGGKILPPQGNSKS